MMNEVKETWNALINLKLVKQAGDAWNKGNFPKAIDIYTKLLALDSLSDEKLSLYHELRADVYNESGEHEKALIDYFKAIEINPFNDRAHAKQGETYYILEDEDEAYKSAHAALLINEDNEMAQDLIRIIEELD